MACRPNGLRCVEVYCNAWPAMPPEKVYVVYAPYLPLNERVLVGP